MTNYFSSETISYLEKSFSKIEGFESNHLTNIFEWLSTVPKYTTIRLNKCLINDTNESLKELQKFVDQAYDSLKLPKPKLEIANDLLNECVVFKSNDKNESIEELKAKVIVGTKCAQAVLRGADIFVPGIISLSMYSRKGDDISIYVDLSSKCLKGSNAKLFIANNPTSVRFLGNGILEVDRDDLFKNPNPIKAGVGIKIKSLKNNSMIPSFDLIDASKYYLQNLPSIICAKVLDPQENELILDMCSCPGGKTTHIAALVNNKSRIVAFDKVPSKIEKLKVMCELMNAKCVEVYCQDATKIDFTQWKPNSFDRILVDAPCSSLGVRPLVYNEITPAQLISYIKYQKSILDNAVELLKPGGYLVYSTCTLTLEENEEQISWLINKYKNLTIVAQTPYHFSSRTFKFKNINLDEDQLDKLQRFMPSHLVSFESNLNISPTNNCLHDTNGFFIAKLYKNK